MPITQTNDNNDTGLLDGLLSTYSASAVWAAAGSATDVFTITGSGSKTIKIREIQFVMTATTGSNATVKLIKRSTANSAGTSGTPTIVPWDSDFSAATASVRNYTANPTLGTSVGDLLTRTIYNSGGGTVGSSPLIFSYTPSVCSPITLRGTSQVLSINLNGVTFAGNSCRATIIWTEE